MLRIGSRPPKSPLAPATDPPPTVVRNASRVAVMLAGVAPLDSKTIIAPIALLMVRRIDIETMIEQQKNRRKIKLALYLLKDIGPTPQF